MNSFECVEDLLDSSDSESRDNIRAKIQFKIKQQANLLSQLAFSLSDDILDTSLEKARAQENLESLQITSCESNSTSFRRNVLDTDDSSDDDKFNIQQNLVQHLKDEYQDLSGLLERMKATMADIMESLSHLDNAPSNSNEEKQQYNCLEQPLADNLNVQIREKAQEITQPVLVQQNYFQDKVEVHKKEKEQQMALMTYSSESEREQAVASAEKPEVSTEACTFSLDINIEALNPQGPRKVLESRNLKWPQWENQNFFILYNRPDKFSETLRSKSFVNINKQRLTFREDKDQYPEPIDVYLGEEEADLGFLYAMGDEYIHTRLRSPSPKRNSGNILRNVDRKITPELCSTCRSVNNRISARNEFTKRSQSPSKWLHSISMCCQHEKDTKPSILTYPVIRQYHEEKERMLMKNPKIEKYNSPERNWNRTESTKLPNKNIKRAEKFRSRLTNCNSQSEASFLLHKEKELQKSEWGLGDNIRHHPGRSRDVHRGNMYLKKNHNCCPRGRNRSTSSPGSPTQLQTSVQTTQSKQRMKVQPSQCAQLEKTRKPSILNLTIEIPSPPEVPVSQTSCMRDADTVVHIHGTGSMGRLSIALETDDIDSLKMRTCVSDDKIIANYYNSISYPACEHHQRWPKRTRWGVAQIDEFGNGSHRYKIMSGNPGRVEIIITLPKST